MKKIVFVIFMLLLLLGAQASALAKAPQSYSEGVNTSCKVRFAPYDGPHRDMFLSEGDRIAVISPSALPSREQVDATVNGLRSWGYIPVEGKHVCDEVRSKEDCLEDLRWALEDPSIKAVFCVRGGYGASEVMDEMCQLFDVIAISAGMRGMQIMAAPDDLVKATKATVNDLLMG